MGRDKEKVQISLVSKFGKDSSISFGEREATSLLQLLFIEDLEEFKSKTEDAAVPSEANTPSKADSWKCKLSPNRKNILQLVR